MNKQPVADLRDLVRRLEVLCLGTLSITFDRGCVAIRESDGSMYQVVDFGAIVNEGLTEETLPSAVYALFDAVQDSMATILKSPWPTLGDRTALTVETELLEGRVLKAGFKDADDWVWDVPILILGEWGTEELG